MLNTDLPDPARFALGVVVVEVGEPGVVGVLGVE